MITKLLVLGVLPLALVATGTPVAWSQQSTRATVEIPVKFRYSVKFVCGQAQEPKPCLEFREGGSDEVKWICPEATAPAGANGAQVVKGLYATAINVHNPNLLRRSGTTDGTVVFAKKAAFALPWQKSGPVSRFERAVLRPNHAFEIDCEEITSMFLKSPSAGPSSEPPFPTFLKGFLVIMSPAELDVTAVYTARGSGGPAMDVSVIEPRKQAENVEADVTGELPTD